MAPTVSEPKNCGFRSRRASHSVTAAHEIPDDACRKVVISSGFNLCWMIGCTIVTCASVNEQQIIKKSIVKLPYNFSSYKQKKLSFSLPFSRFFIVLDREITCHKFARLADPPALYMLVHENWLMVSKFNKKYNTVALSNGLFRENFVGQFHTNSRQLGNTIRIMRLHDLFHSNDTFLIICC